MPRAKPSLVYVGIRSNVVAFDRKNGVEVWRVALPARYRTSATFVNVVRDRDGLFATCGGELFALDPNSGAILWQDPLKGLGTGLLTIATDLGGNTGTAVLEETARQAQAAAAAAAG